MKVENSISINQLMEPIIKKFGEKEKSELINEINKIKNHLRLLCLEFPDLEQQNIEEIRKFLLVLKINSRILEQILERSMRTGFIMAVFALLFGFIMRFHFLFVFVPRQVHQNGSFGKYIAGSGKYAWYLSDPIGLLLLLLCSLLILLGLTLGNL